MNKNVYDKINSKLIKLKYATDKDDKFLLKLFNKLVIEKKTFTTKKVSLKHHKIWLKKKISNKSFHIIFFNENERAGYVRFDKINIKKFVVSIAVNKKFKGYNVAKIALFKALNKIKLQKIIIIAKIKSNNLESKKFFLKCGFMKKKYKNEYFLKYN